MGLLHSCINVISPFIADADILLLGYQDLVLDGGEVALGIADIPRHPKTGHPETRETFTRWGARSVMIIDRAEIRGGESIVDLNEPQSLGDFDLVVDSGTIEHCFCPGTALMNAASAVRVGGRIFHTPPLTMLNHGFYNINPTLYHDFYTQNGWVIEKIEGRQKKGRGEVFKVPMVERFEAPFGAVLHVLARRVAEGDLRVPVQGKYMGAT